MEWVASTLHTTSEHAVSSITTADAHILAASSRVNWRPRRFKWTRPFRRKTKYGFCSCAITFQLASTYLQFFFYIAICHQIGFFHVWRYGCFVFISFSRQLITMEPSFHSLHHFRNIDCVVNLPRKFVGVSWCVLNCYFCIMLVPCQVSGTHCVVIRSVIVPVAYIDWWHQRYECCPYVLSLINRMGPSENTAGSIFTTCEDWYNPKVHYHLHERHPLPRFSAIQSKLSYLASLRPV